MHRAINSYFVRKNNKKIEMDITVYNNLHSLNIQQITIANEIGQVIKRAC